MANRKNNIPIFIPDEQQRRNVKYITRWAVTGLLIGFFVSLFSIPINDYELFDLLGSITPGIDIWTNGTIHQHSAKAMWIYVTYSVPFLIYKMVVTTKKAVILRPMYLILALPPFAYMFCSLLLTGLFLGFSDFIGVPEDNSALYWSFYSHTIVGANLIPLSLGVPCIFACYPLIIFIIEQFNLRPKIKGVGDK